MQVYQDKQGLQAAIVGLKKKSKIVGLVPTMGALHEGHLSLVEQAHQVCDAIVVSIFVNPTQFNNASDLEKYPRTLEDDLALLEKNYKNLIIFAPQENEIYGEEITSEKFNFGNLAFQMEGKFRDGHFDGVGTILKRLFDIVRPDKAFFGEKDFQQLLIVKKLVQLTQQEVEVIGCPISRENNGLARSSRNKRLTATEIEKAGFIYEILKKAEKKFGTKDALLVKQEMEEHFKNSQDFLDLEYFEISDAETLKPISEGFDHRKKYRAFVAAYANDVRLIDNIALN
ncbi:pantoate--beta-alanine ligase [Mesonia aestuariivivens]|uniref:Pantothenate synthetase n=1 Tax=Mesonia aestuariivivens TaxID=2796128 RepID=A0ABS6VXI2_9FLAO|nr:pantoate--beta-alanine ligase [Mesonia aestuariivivens]MBW2960282.1 pantoate--beta-alanine ligase [Mesonia aestuariivivens]